MNRREILKLLSISLGASLTPSIEAAALSFKPRANKLEGSWTHDQREITYICVELIMPQTETPSALQVGVGDFIDFVVNSWFTNEERKNFLRGLDEIDSISGKQYDNAFLALSGAERIELLNQIEANGSENRPSRKDKLAYSSFLKLKELTVVGYYTSEIGLKAERAYVPMPGRYDGFFRFDQVGKQWAS